MIVTLPSGHRAPLEPAGLDRLVACGGTISGLCHAVWAHPDLAVTGVLCSDKADAIAVAQWALDQLVESDDVARLISVSQFTGQAPSVRLRITNPNMALRFDEACLLACKRFADAQAEAQRDDTFNAPPGGINV
jgi:hypothetical protein